MGTRSGRWLLASCLCLVAIVTAAGADQPDGRKPHVDSSGDPLPVAAVARLGTLRWRQPFREFSGAATLSFSPDGKVLAWPGSYGLRVWEVPSRRQELAVGSHRWDDERNNHSEIKLWDLPTGKARATYHDTLPNLRSLAISPDGKLLAVAGAKERDSPAELKLLDAGTGRELAHVALGLERRAHHAIFSPDGRLLAVITPSGVRVWKVLPAKEK